MDQLVLFLIFLKASALSVGGLASLPLLRADLVPANVNDTQIVQALAIGRLTPGPNGLYIVSLGYLAAGWYGALAALIAASLVPLVMLPATSLARRWLLSRWFAGLVRGVGLATAGLLTATGLSIVDASGTAPWQLVLVAIAVVLSIDGRLHPAILVAAGAVAGFAFGRP
ncbi:MAG TPA: chromate transporter [Candidatus Limnocylindria bacterium]